ncbi:MAG: hypothetical protein KY451_03805 [Actinobacteria bacterium]|nr:hypothetical protein [Actinomycetota bacterium]MBW3646726.1 hypothetical protein [Actinomycetota bacterium]
MDGAPGLVVLAWAKQDALYGVAPGGAVYYTADGGTSWQRRGTVAGDPEALTLDVRDGKQVLYVAATDRGILGSADGGMSFTTRYQEWT